MARGDLLKKLFSSFKHEDKEGFYKIANVKSISSLRKQSWKQSPLINVFPMKKCFLI
jgi:hypothetical protein